MSFLLHAKVQDFRTSCSRRKVKYLPSPMIRINGKQPLHSKLLAKRFVEHNSDWPKLVLGSEAFVKGHRNLKLKIVCFNFTK